MAVPRMAWAAVALLVLLSSSATATPSQLQSYLRPINYETAGPKAFQPEGRCAVASENSICSDVGIQLCKDGGNAMDMYIGTALCVGVTNMHHSGAGGGGFSTVRSPEGKHKCIDFREMAPAAAFEDMFKDNVEGSILSGLASGVPGELAGFEYGHRNFGVLPWEDVIRPAVNLARYGFPLNEDLALVIDATIRSRGWNFFVEDPNWAQDFAPHSRLPKLGETITRKRYATVLETVGKLGARAFYEGPIAEATIRAIQSANGTMTLQDLADYKVVEREPISIDYRGWKVTSCSAPTSGALILSALKTIEGYDMSDKNITDLNTHRFTEALRFAYAAHYKLGDPDFTEGMDAFEARTINATTAEYVRGKISDEHTLNVTDYNPEKLWLADTAGTSHISTADASGMAVAGTTTVNLLFGSQLMVPETGVILNNQMNDFSIPNVSNEFGYVSSPINYIRPGKRPLSSTTPVIVEYPDGKPYIITGAAGGSHIPTATIQALWHVLDHNMTMLEALQQPRLHDQLLPNKVTFEYAFNNDTVDFMRNRGHEVQWVGGAYSAAQGIRRLFNGTFEVSSEPRQKASGGFAY